MVGCNFCNSLLAAAVAEAEEAKGVSGVRGDKLLHNTQ